MREDEHEPGEEDGEEGVGEPEGDGGVEGVCGREVLEAAGGGGDYDDGGLDDGFLCVSKSVTRTYDTGIWGG